MPLHEFQTDEQQILQTKMRGSDLKFKQVVVMAKKLIEEAGLPLKSAVYIVDLDFYNGKEYIDHCMYELHLNSIGSGVLEDFAHIINYEGNISHTIVQVIPKPKLVSSHPTVAVRRVKFNEQFGEHEVRTKLSELFEKATSELGKIGFPDLDTERQSYRLKFSYYYLNRHIKTMELKWNPKNVVDEREEIGSEEYVELLNERPDHVRLLDLRVDTVSLYWLQDLINKTLKERLRKLKLE